MSAATTPALATGDTAARLAAPSGVATTRRRAQRHPHDANARAVTDADWDMPSSHAMPTTERPFTLRKIQGIAGAAALTALLAGCGTQQAGAPPQSPPAGVANTMPPRAALSDLPTAPTKGLSKGLTLPLDQYTTQPADGYAWKVAVHAQWRSCMARYGFQDFGPPQVSAQSVTTETNAAMGRRYGISDLDLAKKYGYHLSTDTKEPPYWEPAPGAESDVFTGAGPSVEGGVYQGQKIPEGGCRGEARRMFPMPQTPQAERVGFTAFQQSQKDADVVKSIAQWSSCMKRKGFERNHPLEDLGKLGISLSSPKAGKKEIAVAVADVECKKETGLVKVWNTEERGIQAKAISEHKSKLAKEKSTKDKTIVKVRQAYGVAGN
ncbi:hypothetical protein [Streptomyces jumonjinensis]|uniref:hypothetical protein n=1 Tax=Streptomyces jumonjinensis TaxID=1945 RepID=UPI00379DB45D